MLSNHDNNGGYATFTNKDGSVSVRMYVKNGRIEDDAVRTIFHITSHFNTVIYRWESSVMYALTPTNVFGRIFWELHEGWKEHTHIVESTAADIRTTSLIAKWESRVFQVFGLTCIGSGILLSGQRILTAAHLSFRLNGMYTVRAVSCGHVTAKCVFICAKRDFAILQSQYLPEQAEATDNLRRGDNYYIMGFPSGVDNNEPALTQGVIEGYMTDKIHLVGTPGSKRGYSGAPVFNTFGRLAGILLGSTSVSTIDSTIRECLYAASEQQYARILQISTIYVCSAEPSDMEC